MRITAQGSVCGTRKTENILFIDIQFVLIRSEGVLNHALAVRGKEAPVAIAEAPVPTTVLCAEGTCVAPARVWAICQPFSSKWMMPSTDNMG
jgi:hypothetical protein